MVLGPHTKNYCAGEGQEQFTDWTGWLVMARSYSWVRREMVASRQQREHGSSGAASLDAVTKQRLAKIIKGWDLACAIVICLSVYVSDSVKIFCSYELKVFKYPAFYIISSLAEEAF
jgi:hypothetical protein